MIKLMAKNVKAGPFGKLAKWVVRIYQKRGFVVFNWLLTTNAITEATFKQKIWKIDENFHFDSWLYL